jgi:hypothetical protein
LNANAKVERSGSTARRERNQVVAGDGRGGDATTMTHQVGPDDDMIRCLPLLPLIAVFEKVLPCTLDLLPDPWAKNSCPPSSVLRAHRRRRAERGASGGVGQWVSGWGWSWPTGAYPSSPALALNVQCTLVLTNRLQTDAHPPSRLASRLRLDSVVTASTSRWKLELLPF